MRHDVHPEQLSVLDGQPPRLAPSTIPWSSKRVVYRVGPLSVAAVDWPAPWTAYADRHFPRCDDRHQAGGQVELAFGGCTLAADELEEVTDPARYLRGSGVGGPVWRMWSGQCFAATFDVATSRCVVRPAAEDGDPHLVLGNPLRCLAATLLPLRHDGLLVHASAGIHDGRGVVFAGISTAGKTTMAMGFKDVTYLTDDISLLGSVSTTPTLLATPFYGAMGVRGAERQAPLAAFCVLGDKQPPGTKTRIERVGRGAGLPHVMRHVARFFPERPLAAQLLELCGSLVERVPVYLVHRSIEDASDDVVRQVLSAIP